MSSRDDHAASAAERRQRTRFYVRAGLSFEARWVVIDRDIDAVVAEFDRRKDAQDYVKERNG